VKWMPFKSMNHRTMFLLLPAIIIGLGSTMGLILYESKQITEGLIHQNVEHQMDATVSVIEAKLTAHSRITETMARSVDAIGADLTEAQYEAILTSVVSQN